MDNGVLVINCILKLKSLIWIGSFPYVKLVSEVGYSDLGFSNKRLFLISRSWPTVLKSFTDTKVRNI
jgi:hypothetical protein